MKNNPVVKLALVVLGFIIVITLAASLKSPINDLGAFAAPSLIVAYLGGVLSIISPCSIAVLPAFFAITFREKEKLRRAVLIFSFGLISVFVPLGIGASFIAKPFFEYRNIFLIAAGIVLVFFGIFTVLGKSFHLFQKIPQLNNAAKGSFKSLFLMGALFAFGTGSCAAAIYGGILTLAAAANTVWYGALLLMVFSAGLITPIYILSAYFDKIDISKAKWLQGRVFQIKLGNKDLYLHSTNIIAGALLIFTGILFIIWKGTTVFQPFFDKAGLLSVYYNLNEWILLNLNY